MNLSVNDKVAIVCKIAQGFCEKEGIQLPNEISDFIQTTLSEGSKDD